MEATDGPSTSTVPAAVADPTLAAGPTPVDTPMLPAVRAVTDASFQLFMAQTHSRTAQQQIQPQTTLRQAAPPC